MLLERLRAEGKPLRRDLSILSQLLLGLSNIARSASEWRRTFNSFPVAAPRGGQLDRRLDLGFQFFPSCCTPPPETTPAPLTKFTFNSFPVAARRLAATARRTAPRSFNSFPVAARTSRGPSLGGRPSRHGSFQFFPSCCQIKVKKIPIKTYIAFNSFPVAAETLAAWLLINLSSANFEVRESSPALPPDACMDSCKPFPDSRRKEGIWRERNGV